MVDAVPVDDLETRLSCYHGAVSYQVLARSWRPQRFADLLLRYSSVADENLIKP